MGKRYPCADQAGAIGMRRRTWLLLNGALALVGTLIYLNGVATPFLFDDASAVLSNDRIRRLSDVPGVLSPERERPVAGRPLVNLSLAINYAIGGLNVYGYHIANIALHVLCGLLLFAVVRRALLLPRLPAALRDRSTPLGFTVALLWIVHPINSEVVTYVTQRTESMMAFFYLLTLYASLRAR
jgi:protein O-mannosyl-transferase